VTTKAQTKKKRVDICPNLDSTIYHLKWVSLNSGCYLGNQGFDSVFVLNSCNINFKELIKLTGIKKLKSLSNVDKGVYIKYFPPLYITQKLTLGEKADDVYYEDHSELFGYLTLGKNNYLVIRGYGACMGYCTNLLSINQNNELIDQIMITADYGGKYGDGDYYSLKQINDSTYYQVYEILGCKGWNDNVKKDSLFREFYQKSKITLSYTGYLKKEIIETDSTSKFLKMVNICGPE